MADPTSITNCRACGSADLAWDTHNKINSAVQQGRLNTNDVTCVFTLGCNQCSETQTVISAAKVANLLNAKETP